MAGQLWDRGRDVVLLSPCWVEMHHLEGASWLLVYQPLSSELFHTWASLVSQMVKNLPAVQENQENPVDRGAWWATFHRGQKKPDTPEQLSTHIELSPHCSSTPRSPLTRLLRAARGLFRGSLSCPIRAESPALRGPVMLRNKGGRVTGGDAKRIHRWVIHQLHGGLGPSEPIVFKGGSEKGDSALQNVFEKKKRKSDICNLDKRKHKRHIHCFQILKGCQMEEGLAPAEGSGRKASFSLFWERTFW